MSFLNPVNEPVKRFSSTDADAPQINYNARVAGDVKTVLKTCLVTGYGAKAGAGWSIVSEVGNIAEFVSPSADMSDYKLGIDDTITSSTTWYYRYQDTRINPFGQGVDRIVTNINKLSEKNGWQLITTSHGVLFIEIMQVANGIGIVCRVTYFGRLKSMMQSSAENNIAFYNVGWHGITKSKSFFGTSSTNKLHLNLFGLSNFTLASVDMARHSNSNAGVNLTVDINSQIFVRSSYTVVACLPALLVRTPAILTDIFNIQEITIDGRYFLSLTTTYQFSDYESRKQLAVDFVVPLDYWEY